MMNNISEHQATIPNRGTTGRVRATSGLTLGCAVWRVVVEFAVRLIMVVSAFSRICVETAVVFCRGAMPGLLKKGQLN